MSWAGLAVTTAVAAALPAVLWAVSTPLTAAFLVVTFVATLLVARRVIAVVRQLRRTRQPAFEVVAAAVRPPAPWRSTDAGELAEPASERSAE